MTDPSTSLPSPETAGWDPAAGLREVFLQRLGDHAEAETLRHLVALLHRRKTARGQPPSPGSTLRADLGAAVDDLRHLQGFLADTGAVAVDGLAEKDHRLVLLAQELADSLGRIADLVEETLQ
jgi:hypothetical protein